MDDKLSLRTLQDDFDSLDKLKAPKESPAFTGVPLTPTPALNDSSQRVANTEFVQSLTSQKVAALKQEILGGASTALDTLKEVENALKEHDGEYDALVSVVGTKYVKPSTGIPRNDLESTVKTSLSKADTAVQPSGNVASASKLQTARTLSFTGDVTGSGSFDGSTNVTINIDNTPTSTVNYATHSNARLVIPVGINKYAT